MAILLSFPLQIGTRGQYFDLPRTPARATPAGMPPFGLRRQTGSQERENQSSELSSVAAPAPQPQLPRARKRLPKAPAIFDFGFSMVRRCSPQVFDCRIETTGTRFEMSWSCLRSPI